MNVNDDKLKKATVAELVCHALRHRWIPVAAHVGNVVGGAQVYDWELHCKTGCLSRATEWRDALGVRVPGTQRQYYPTRSYQESGGYDQSDYFKELQERGIENIWDEI